MARRLSFSSSSSSSSPSPSPSPSLSLSPSLSPSPAFSSGNRVIAAAAAAVAGFKPFVPSLRTTSSPWSNNDIGGDRFIPVRLPDSRPYVPIIRNKTAKAAVADDDEANPSRLAYRRAIADALMPDRVLSFRARPVAHLGPEEEMKPPVALLPKQRMRRWHVPKAPSMTLEIPDLWDNIRLNLLDWGSANVLAVALEDTVSLWDDSNKSAWQVDSFSSRVTSLGWAPDGRRIAVGLDSSELELWNWENSGGMIRAFSDVHGGYRITSIAWKDNNVLATSGVEGDVLLHDLRLESPVVKTFYGHRGEVCALKWSSSGQYLAGGGDLDLLVWDVSMAASTDQRTPWLHRMHDHKSTVKALAWCPFQNNLLASGGIRNDGCIKFWNTSTGRLLNSVDTDSDICSLQWSMHERQLISSHGGPRNQLTVWNYPSMAKAGELIGHQDRALFTAQSPDGYTMVSASLDESLVFWQFFEDSKARKPLVPKSNSGLFSG